MESSEHVVSPYTPSQHRPPTLCIRKSAASRIRSLSRQHPNHPAGANFNGLPESIERRDVHCSQTTSGRGDGRSPSTATSHATERKAVFALVLAPVSQSIVGTIEPLSRLRRPMPVCTIRRARIHHVCTIVRHVTGAEFANKLTLRCCTTRQRRRLIPSPPSERHAHWIFARVTLAQGAPASTYSVTPKRKGV